MAESKDRGGGGDTPETKTAAAVCSVEKRLHSLLSPYEPLIMSVQSILVWECPWKSAVVFTLVHVLFWFICTTSSRFFFLLSVCVMVAVFIDTWKNKIWPEIRVPPDEPEDKDGWTPVHLRLLSVPEISTHLSNAYVTAVSTFQWLRKSRISHPLVFCLGNTAFFTGTAVIGSYISGIMLAYLMLMSLMVLPSVSYHSLLSKAYVKMEPYLVSAVSYLRIKGQYVLTLGGRISLSQSASPDGPRIEVADDDDFYLKGDQESVAAALAKAISDSEDEGQNTTLDTPRLSKSPSFSNGDGEDDAHEHDFELDLNQMPSFDDLDNTDDELELPETPDTPSSSRLKNSLLFSSKHFAESSPESESSPLDFDRSDSTASTSAQAAQALTGALVARTITTMMESALQGVATMGQGQTASSSSMISPRTGAKLTYTYSQDGESIDFQNAQPTIDESEEDTSDIQDESSRRDQIAEIEKDFDFLDELDPEDEDDV